MSEFRTKRAFADRAGNTITEPVEGMKFEKIEPMTPNEDKTPFNPFQQDLFHMGTKLGKNITILHRNFPKDNCEYLILVNTITGEQIKVTL